MKALHLYSKISSRFYEDRIALEDIKSKYFSEGLLIYFYIKDDEWNIIEKPCEIKLYKEWKEYCYEWINYDYFASLKNASFSNIENVKVTPPHYKNLTQLGTIRDFWLDRLLTDLWFNTYIQKEVLEWPLTFIIPELDVEQFEEFKERIEYHLEEVEILITDDLLDNLVPDKYGSKESLVSYDSKKYKSVDLLRELFLKKTRPKTFEELTFSERFVFLSMNIYYWQRWEDEIYSFPLLYCLHSIPKWESFFKEENDRQLWLNPYNHWTYSYVSFVWKLFYDLLLMKDTIIKELKLSKEEYAWYITEHYESLKDLIKLNNHHWNLISENIKKEAKYLK